MLSFHPSINSKILTGFKGISWGCGVTRVELGEPVQTLVVLQIEVCGGGGRNLPQDVNVLILETYVCVILQDKRTTNEVKDLAMAKYTGLYR